MEGRGKCHEHQSRTLALCPGHRAAQQEGRGLEAFLRRALDVSRGRRVVQFDVVAAAPADGLVLRLRGHRFEAAEVVHPLLHGNEAAAVQPGALSGDDGCRDRIVAGGVFGAVLVTAQVPAHGMAEGFDHLVQRQHRAHRGLHGACQVYQMTPVLAAQPAPQSRRCGR